MMRASRHSLYLAGTAAFLVLLFAAGLSPALAALAVEGAACTGATALEQPPLDATEASDGTGGDQGTDELSVPAAAVPFAMPVTFLAPRNSTTPGLLLVRSLFHPPTLL